MIVLSPAPKSYRYWNFEKNAAAQLSETRTDERTFRDIFGEKTSTPSMSVYRCCCCGKSSPIFYWQISLSFFTNFFFGRDWEGKEDATRRVNCVTFVGPLPPPDATMLVFICRGFYFFEKLSAHDTTPPYSHLGSRLRILFNKSSAGIIIWWA